MLLSDKEKVYKGYLGAFYNYNWTKDEFDLFKKNCSILKSDYIKSTNTAYLHKLAKFILLAHGKLDYKYLVSYDIIFSYFDEGALVEGIADGASRMEWFDTITPVMFVYHPVSTPNNKMLEPALAYLTSCRMRNNKTTIFLVEKDLMDVRTLYPSLSVEAQEVKSTKRSNLL